MFDSTFNFVTRYDCLQVKVINVAQGHFKVKVIEIGQEMLCNVDFGL